jgi:hypothetical protein
LCNLEFIPTDELMEEILKRMDHGVIGLIKIKDGDNTQQIARRWKGNSHTCCGLCANLSSTILRDLEENLEEIDSL